MAVIAPYGSWASPITAELLVEKAVQLSGVQVDGDTVYWVEGRPAEGGRQALVRRLPDGSTEDVLPPDGNARTLVHEYGGRSYAVRDGVVVFASFADQRLWRLDPGASEPVALTAEPPTPRGVRFGDLELTPDGRFVLAVRERHLGSSATDVVNDVVAVPIGGGEPVVLAEGHDFYAAPRIAPAGDRICWLSWDHPNMPWDGTELFTAPFQDGARHGEPTHLAGGPEESVSRPRWSPEGRLHFASDRSGWWNLYREGDDQPLHRADAEFSGPDWWLGASTYAFLPDGRVVAAYARGRPHPAGGAGRAGAAARRDRVDVPGQRAAVPPAGIVAIAASPTDPDAVVRIAVPDGAIDVLRASRTLAVDPSWISVAEPITFPTEDGLQAHAFWYPPVNPDFAAPAGELPPLIVMSHGGPTGATPTGARPRAAVLDQPRLRGRRRRLRRQHAATAAPTASGSATAGASSTSTTASTPRAGWPSRAGRRRPHGDPRWLARAGTRRWLPSRSATSSPPGPATSASPTRRRWRWTRTSSRAATSTG